MTRLRRFAAAVAWCGLAVTGCSHGGSKPTSGVRTLPDIAGFLRNPVATPSICPSHPADSDGLASPWKGHVDISVYLRTHVTRILVTALGRELRNTPHVQRVYFEPSAEAYAEFQRLYSCWAQVPRSEVPASYRVVLEPTATIAQRNDLVARMVRHAGVDSVSCDPSLPCVDVVRSAEAATGNQPQR